MKNNKNFLLYIFLLLTILTTFSTLSLAQVLTFQSPAPVSDGLFGIAPCSPGDLNGDGKSELIFSEIAGTNYSGKVHIFSGANGSIIRTLTSPNPQNGGIFLYTAIISDLNGDTVPEIIVGASGEDITQGPTTYYMTGRAYLFNGATGALVHTFEPPTPEDYASFGIRSCEIGDNNGDGTKDILIAQNQTSTTNNINVHIFSGNGFSLLKTLEVPISDTDSDGLTGSVSGIIDMDFDGKEDIIIGLPRQQNGLSVETGAIVIFSSNTGNLIRQIDDPDPRDDNWFGTYFKLLPDRNSDGKPEIITWAYEATQPGFSGYNQGVAYIFSSADGSLLNTIFTPNPENNGYFGSTVCTMGDLDGDSTYEIVIGSQETYQYSHDEKVYIFSGATLSHITTLHSPTPAYEGYFGGVNTVPDIDGKGKTIY